MDEPERPSGEPGTPFVERMLLGQPITARRAARIIALAALSLTVAGGILVRIIDRREFDSLGDGMWWALQTVTTVGYGDLAPEQTGGRIVGAILMLQGIALISVVTAGVTAMLIEQARRRRQGPDEMIAERLDRIEAQLSRLEAAATARRDPPADR